MENRRQPVGANVEPRYQRLVTDGALRCPLCGRVTRVPPSGRITLRVFDEFRGHLLGHDVLEFVEAMNDRATVYGENTGR